MKLLCLNIWGGRMLEPLKQFLTDHADIDIFCFQEVYHDAQGKDLIWTDGTDFDSFAQLSAALPSHTPFYHPHLEDWWGLATFVRKELTVTDSGEHYVHLHKGHDLSIEVQGHTAKNIQYVEVLAGEKPVTIMNMHGLWNGKGKTDTDARLEQSRKVIEFAKTASHPFVLCGDLNLSPDTESLQMLERELPARDLIKEFGITSTRTPLYDKPNKFADYVFVSEGIDVKEFSVLPDVLSDHAALYLEFS